MQELDKEGPLTNKCPRNNAPGAWLGYRGLYAVTLL